MTSISEKETIKLQQEARKRMGIPSGGKSYKEYVTEARKFSTDSVYYPSKRIITISEEQQIIKDYHKNYYEEHKNI